MSTTNRPPDPSIPGGGPAPRPRKPARPNSLNLRSPQLNHILDILDRHEGTPEATRQREYARLPYRLETVVLTLLHAEGNRTRVRVACRNLSRGGIGILHSAYMHPGSRCDVTLQRVTGKPQTIPGRVVRCTHRAGVVHEIGIQFDQPIDLSQFLARDPFTPVCSLERVDPAKLTGCILHIEPDANEREALKHFLRETTCSVVGAESLAAAIPEAAKAGLIIASIGLPDATAIEAVARLRAARAKAPIIFVVPDTSEQVRASLVHVPAQGFLARPLTDKVVLGTIAEWLVVQPRAVKLQEPEDRIASNAGALLGAIGCMDALKASVTSRDAAGVRRAAGSLIQLADARSWYLIAAQAREVCVDIDESRAFHQVRRKVEGLIGSIEQLCEVLDEPGEAMDEQGRVGGGVDEEDPGQEAA